MNEPMILCQHDDHMAATAPDRWAQSGFGLGLASLWSPIKWLAGARRCVGQSGPLGSRSQRDLVWNGEGVAGSQMGGVSSRGCSPWWLATIAWGRGGGRDAPSRVLYRAPWVKLLTMVWQWWRTTVLRTAQLVTEKENEWVREVSDHV
jgi:hypothetical protein